MGSVIVGSDGQPLTASAAVHTTPKSDTGHSPSEVSLDIAENAADAGIYSFVAEVFSIDEAHPELTAEIRRLADPRYVPLLCRRIYKSPAGTEIQRTYYCVGKWIQFPTDDYKDAAVRLSSVPRGFPFPADQIHCLRTLWAPWDTKDAEGRPHHPVEYFNCTPPEVVEIGPWLVEQLCAIRKAFDATITFDGDDAHSLETTASKLSAILEAETRADNARMERAREEARYRMRTNWKQMKDAIDNERWAPKPEEPPLFLDLGKKG